MAKGCLRLLEPGVPSLPRADLFSLIPAGWPHPIPFDFEEGSRPSQALANRPKAILFIDEIHSAVGAGATTGGTMDLATLIKPMLAAGDLRVIGSTTFEEFKHIEKDRALARRLQRITIDEPSVEETVKILGAQSRYEPHHNVCTRCYDRASPTRVPHLRDSRC